MKKSLENKIITTHPLLYRDRYGDARSTCMVWGLSVDDGWYRLIWNLSQKLEPLIEEFIKQNPDLGCAACGCNKEDHYKVSVLDWNTKKSIETGGGCNIIHHLPYTLYVRYGCIVPQWKRDFLSSFKSKYAFKKFWYNEVIGYTKYKIKHKVYTPINKVLNWLYEKWNFGYDKQCHCKGFLKNHPCAAQVKEKFGGMRFYMTTATDEMFDLIENAEAESFKICEKCGAPGKPINTGWIRTLCDQCDKERFAK